MTSRIITKYSLVANHFLTHYRSRLLNNGNLLDRKSDANSGTRCRIGIKAGVIEHGNITRDGIVQHGVWCQQGIKQGMENLGIYLALGIGLGLGGFIFASTCLYVWKTTETNDRRTGSPIKHNAGGAIEHGITSKSA